MPNIPRTAKKQHLLMGLVILTSLALYVYCLYVLQPIARRVIQLSRQVREVNGQVHALEQLVTQSTNLQKEYASLQSRVAQLRGQLPSEENLPEVIEWVSELASQTGVKILSIFPQRASPSVKVDAQASSELYRPVIIELDALAGFHQLGMFLGRVESGDRSLEVDQLMISQSERELRRHNVKLILQTYVTTTDDTET